MEEITVLHHRGEYFQSLYFSRAITSPFRQNEETCRLDKLYYSLLTFNKSQPSKCIGPLDDAIIRGREEERKREKVSVA